MGEFETISTIRQLAEKVRVSEHVRLGIGDDCCMVVPGEGEEIALSTDTIVEDVHFRVGYFDYYQIGVKAAAAALSDLAAMAAIPVGSLASICIRRDQNISDLIIQLSRGIIDTGARFGCPLIGGDLSSSIGPLVVNITVIGRVQKDGAIKRSGARPGDGIWVTGNLGDSSAALVCLEERLRDGGKKRLPEPFEMVKKSLFDPVPRLVEARLLKEFGPPSAMIDISDGLAADLGHILEASQVGATLYAETFPVSEFSKSVAMAHGLPPWHFFLYGGEDYELCFTAQPGLLEKHIPRLKAKTGTNFSYIGKITKEDGSLTFQHPDGSLTPVSKSGFDHFTDHSPIHRKDLR